MKPDNFLNQLQHEDIVAARVTHHAARITPHVSPAESSSPILKGFHIPAQQPSHSRPATVLPWVGRRRKSPEP